MNFDFNIQDMLSEHNLMIQIPLENLQSYHNHKFKLYDGERLEDMVESIRENGILVPIIVRPCGEEQYEILSGHNRVNAARLAGVTIIPSVVKENLTEEEAELYVIETNLIQRGFNDLRISEKAAVLAVRYSKMFSQGKRNDIISELEMLQNPQKTGENETCAQVGHKLNSREKLADEYGLSRNTVARYVRIDSLIDELKMLLDEGMIAFIPAVSLSYLFEAEQQLVWDTVAETGCKVNQKNAELLRSFTGRLDADKVSAILTGAAVKPPKQKMPAVKIQSKVYSRYFAANVKPKEIESTIEKALELYFQMNGGTENDDE